MSKVTIRQASLGRIFLVFQWQRLKRAPRFYLLLGLMQALLSGSFAWLLMRYWMNAQNPLGLTETLIHPYQAILSLCVFLFTPFITMGAINSEGKQHTLDLLLMSPHTPSELVRAKFFAYATALIGGLLWFEALPCWLGLDHSLDFGQITCALAGTALFLMSSIALGLFFSSLTAEPIVSGLANLISVTFFCLLEALYPRWAVCSPLFHLRPFLNGYLDSFHCAYFMLITLGALYLCRCNLSHMDA